MYVVTFATDRPAYPAQISGLRRMPLAEARKLARLAVRIPRHGRIVNAETLETVSYF